MINRQPRRSISPRLSLAITLGAALAVLVGGICLAWHVQQVHVPGDRKPVQAAGEEMEKEFGQLERLYEKHLRQLASATSTYTDPSGVSEACGSIVGVEQWSLVHASQGMFGDVHVPVGQPPRYPWPRPTFQVKSEGMEPNDLLLSREDLLQPYGPAWGWIADPGKPLLFWQRADSHADAVVVMLIDPQLVHDALDGWLAQWAKKSFAPLQVRNGPLCALESDGRVLMSTGTTSTAEPDFILPIRSLFGTWEIVAWDRITTRTSYDFRTLVLAGFLAFVIVLLGVVAFLQQKRLLAQTAERVTFVNRVSHELRSPLTNILLNLDLSLDMLAEQGDKPAHRLALVQEEAHRLRRLVDNVLTFSSLEQKKLRSERRACIPDKLIQGVVRQFAPSFARREIVVTCTGNALAPCLLDADAVTQILANLFSNIEKYAPRGIVTIEADQRSDVLRIMVSDQGPGIPPGEAERIFQPFERVDGRIDEGASGTGLGLSIARELAVGMGGSLRLIPGRLGASFELRVPALSIAAATGSFS
jgi:signal transduction histidine kinase